jgi:hypothetical protein
MAEPVFCTKIASRLVRTYTDRHGLKDLVPSHAHCPREIELPACAAGAFEPFGGGGATTLPAPPNDPHLQPVDT